MAYVTHEQRAALRRHLRARMDARGIEVPDRIAAQIAALLDEALDDDLLALPQPLRPDAADEDSRIVVTGLGAVSPLGLDAPSSWDAAVSGRSGVGFIEAFDASAYPVRIAAEVTDRRGRGDVVRVPVGLHDSVVDCRHRHSPADPCLLTSSDTRTGRKV